MKSNASRIFSICMISDDFLPEVTGVGVHLQHMMVQLLKLGHKVCIITTKRPGQEAEEVWNGVKVYRCSSIRMFGFYQAFASKAAIKNILTENQVEIVHFHYLSFLLIQAFNAAQELAIKTIYTYHMTADHLTQPLLMKPYRPLIAKMIVHYCNKFGRILAPSRQLVDDIKRSGVNTPAYFINNPVVFESKEISKISRDDVDFLVFYAGRLNKEKNIPFLIRGFARILNERPRAQLWIAGQGDMRNMLEREVNNLDIASSVKFLGHIPHEHLGDYYSIIDVFVLPSLIETQGMVAMEAMRFGKPVIVTNSIVSADELVTQGENGFIVDSESVDDLAQKLGELAGDSSLREKMGKEGWERSRQYDPESVTTTLVKHYQALFDRD